MKNRLGVGISLDPARIGTVNYYVYDQYYRMITNISPITFYLPINVTEKFRVEPSFGLYTINFESTTTSNDPNYSSSAGSNDISTITAGLRGLYISSLSNSFGLYFGPKLELNFLSSTQTDSYTTANPKSTVINKTETTETDITLGLIFGAEYFPISHFSIGGEGSFNYTSFGNPEITNTIIPPPTNPSPLVFTEKKQHSFHTDVLFFVRWYFL